MEKQRASQARDKDTGIIGYFRKWRKESSLYFNGSTIRLEEIPLFYQHLVRGDSKKLELAIKLGGDK